MITCSFLVPSRGRPFRAAKAIDSFFKFANDKTKIEVLLRVDDDDEYTKEHVGIFNRPNVTLIWGKTGGWTESSHYYGELGRAAKGKWLWLFNDDAYLDGYGYDTILAGTSTEKTLIQPQWYMVGKSRYKNPNMTGMPIIPNTPELVQVVNDVIGAADNFLVYRWVPENNWKITWLEGISAIHEHGPDYARLEEHERMLYKGPR